MFNKKIDSDSPVSTSPFEAERSDYAPSNDREIATNLSKDTHFKGSLTFDRTLKIEGSFEGDITTSGTLLIGKEAEVKAQIHAKTLILEGTIIGNVTVEERLHLKSSAKLIGDIKTGKLVIEEGATVSGQCQTESSGKKSETTTVSTTEESAYRVPVGFNSHS